ncbi:MAG: PEP-CTERM sorting domain-containing protein [Verrucomicrobiota bacterium]
MTRPFHVALFGLFLALVPTTSPAQLLLTVNKLQKTLSFSGSDTGLPADVGSTVWESNQGGPFNVSDPIASLFDVTGNTIGRRNNLLVYEDGGLEIVLDFEQTTQATLNGNGQTQSYLDLQPESIEILEASNGLVLPSTTGTGWSAITVSVVPEPASAGLLALGALGLLWRRRQNAS